MLVAAYQGLCPVLVWDLLGPSQGQVLVWDLAARPGQGSAPPMGLPPAPAHPAH